MKINMIVAVDLNFGIGKNNTLPWKISKDMAYFKKKTIGNKNNAIVMGRKTYESIKHVLPYRKNYVLSKSSTLSNPDISLLNNPDDIFNLLQYDEIWIIGGESIYKYFLNKHPKQINEIYMTQILKEYDCDTFFPKIPTIFNKISSITITDIDKRNDSIIKLDFKIYKS